LHKFLIWAVIWSSILWFWIFAKTKKWKNFLKIFNAKLVGMKEFLKLWYDEFKNKFNRFINKEKNK
jgi:hypothetical protein